MTEKNINAHCAICGKGYHICQTCREQKTFRSWRSVVDSIEHYKIFLAIHGYTTSGDRELARSELENCDLSDLNDLKPEIRSVIQKILASPEHKTRREE